jgi:hypothetical protein
MREQHLMLLGYHGRLVFLFDGWNELDRDARRKATTEINLRVVQLLLGHRKIESTVRYLGIEVDDALAIAEQVAVLLFGVQFWV